MEVKNAMMNDIHANEIKKVYSSIKSTPGITLSDLAKILPMAKVVKTTDLLAKAGKITKGISRIKGQPVKRIFEVA